MRKNQNSPSPRRSMRRLSRRLIVSPNAQRLMPAIIVVAGSAFARTLWQTGLHCAVGVPRGLLSADLTNEIVRRSSRDGIFYVVRNEGAAGRKFARTVLERLAANRQCLLIDGSFSGGGAERLHQSLSDMNQRAGLYLREDGHKGRER